MTIICWNLLGTKSEVLDVDKPDLEKYPLFAKARRYECHLKAGDTLFIPGKVTPALLSFTTNFLY